MTYEDLIREWASASHLTAHTSGSTGTPKAILLPRQLVEYSARRTNKFFGIDSSSTLHSCISPDFIGGKMMAIRALIAGCRFSYETPSNRPFQTAAKDTRFTMVSLVPSQLEYVLSHLDEMPQVTHWLVGGSPLSPALREKVFASGLQVWESYGMTETSSHIAVRRVSPAEQYFHPMEGITLSLDDRGCLVIDQLHGPRCVTNDLAELRADSSFAILGRIDNMIISGGRKINPVEVEALLSPLPGGFCYQVVGKPDEKWTQKVVLVIEGEEQSVRQHEKSILQKIQDIHEPWMRPKEILTIPNFVRTPNGKIKKISF